jgi:hypothetical protein
MVHCPAARTTAALPCTLDWCDAMTHVWDRSIGRSAREQTNDLHGAKALYSKATELDPKNDAAQVLFIGIAVYAEHPRLLTRSDAGQLGARAESARRRGRRDEHVDEGLWPPLRMRKPQRTTRSQSSLGRSAASPSAARGPNRPKCGRSARLCSAASVSQLRSIHARHCRSTVMCVGTVGRA